MLASAYRIPHTANLLLLLALVAASGQAADFGPIRVIPEPPLAPGVRPGSYVERVFTITNDSADAHEVRITIVPTQPESDQPLVVRTLKIGPRTAQRVSMLWLVTMRNPMGARITVDGKTFNQRLNLSEVGYYEYYQRSVLTGRSLDEVVLQKAMMSSSPSAYRQFDFQRSTLPPAEWSSRWLAYDRFSGIIMSRRDWSELPAAVQAAVVRWVRCGGVLLFVPGPEGDAKENPKVAITYAGFGRVLESNRTLPSLTPNLAQYIREAFLATPIGREPEYGVTRSDAGALLGSQKVPTSTLFWCLMLFAVIAGPVALIILAKKNLRVWIFGIVPAGGILLSIAIVVITLLSEGIHTISRLRSVTLLDEVAGEATTLGRAGFYCTFPQDERIRFDGDSEIIPLGHWPALRADLTDGQRLSGAVGSRVPTFYNLRRSEPRRERIIFRESPTSLSALNGLGATIMELRVTMPDGRSWHARNIAPGAQQVLERVPPPVRFADAAALSQLIEGTPSGEAIADRVAGEAGSVMRPGMYIATLATSPFTEQPLGRNKESRSTGVVIGLMKGEIDAR